MPTKTEPPSPRPSAPGLTFERRFSREGVDPFDEIEWEKRRAAIEDSKGGTVFEQKDVEAPKSWSQHATDIVADKYFRGERDTPERESSIRQMIGRVVDTISKWAKAGKYFATENDHAIFTAELKAILVNQRGAFNSPVWFNCGFEPAPQCSACFINSVDDSMESILGLAKTEGMLFKYGSGTGSNLSPIRGSGETLAGGGTASGPVSFMKGYDAFAGVIKSGGKTRRAAKMVILNADHPDVVEFIRCKADEERKAWALIDAGYDGSFNGIAYSSIFFQNSNNSVRVPDAFMRAVADDREWETRAVTDGRVVDTYRARELMQMIADSAHVCGDPGMQFDTTINDWHTCPNTARINASNPCCFVGETEVLTTDGHVRIDALAEMSWKELPQAETHYPHSGQPVLQPILKAWMAGETRTLAEVATSKGLRLRCTHEHRFYLRDGTAVAAADLKPGQELAVQWSHTDDDVESVTIVEVPPTPVYDLEVDTVHRFAVTMPGANHGVLVSNSEYMFLDDSACNLASLNLMRFAVDGETGTFDEQAFCAAVRTLITAQEILVGYASYPTPAIERNSHDYRPLGLGYANLGALLMARGIAYDSDEGRQFAAGITALMTGEAYAQSARIARDCGGPFKGYNANEAPFLRVMEKHRNALRALPAESVPGQLHEAATASWEDALGLGREHGYRNAQATVLAPTGTIGFLMDCDTTGVEPDIGLVKYKHLVGGGTMQIVNQTVPAALGRLCYDDQQIARIVEHIDTHDTIEGAEDLKAEHLPVFDCAFKPSQGSRFIHHRGHLKMIGAVQPFISGAISKTINVPKDTPADEMERCYVEAWRLGSKAVSIYRDGSKRTQPLNTGRDDAGGLAGVAASIAQIASPVRRKLPDERHAITHKFEIGEHEGYITVGMFGDGKPGEIFLVMAKEGSTISGFADGFAQSISYALQYGVPLEVLVDKFSHMRFEPSGMTKNPEVRFAKSIIDYVFRWLASKFLSTDAQYDAGVNIGQRPAATAPAGDDPEGARIRLVSDTDAAEADERAAPAGRKPGTSERYAIQNDEDAPPCASCGAIMIRNGACYKCVNCGNTSGCA